MSQENATYGVYIDWNGDGNYNDLYEDCSSIWMSINIDRGFSDPRSRVARPATATLVLDNQDQYYSPPLISCIRPQRTVEITMTYDGSTVNLFTGYVISIAPTFGTLGERRVTITATDYSELLNFYDARIAMQLDTTADAIIDALVEEVLGTVSTSYQSGINVFPFAADRWEDVIKPDEAADSAMDRITAACASDWGRFFIDSEGKPTFINRHQMPLDTSTVLALDNTMVEMSYEMNVGNIYNSIAITCAPRTVGESYEVVGRMDNRDVPKLESGDTLDVRIDYRDPLSRARIGAVDTQFTTSIDVTATADEAGEGTDMTSSVYAVKADSGDCANIFLENVHATDALYIQRVEVRGQAVRVRDTVTVTSEDSGSVSTYGKRELSLNMPLISDQLHACALADYLLDYYKNPIPDVRGVTFYANRNATLMAAARDLELCDRVEITETQTGLSSWDCFVYGLKHSIQQGGIHTVTLDLEQPYNISVTPFRIDSSGLDSADGLIY